MADVTVKTEIETLRARIARDRARLAQLHRAVKAEARDAVTVTGHVYRAMLQEPDRWWRLREIRMFTPEESLPCVQGRLNALRHRGKIERRGTRGTYMYRAVPVRDTAPISADENNEGTDDAGT